MAKPNPTVSSLVLSAGLLMLTCLPLSGQSNPSSPTPIMGHVINFTISPPFSELAKMPPPPRWNFHEEEKVRRVDFHPGRVLFPSVDPVEQSSPGTAASFTVGLNLLGLDNSAACNCHPPDTNAAVGDTQVVEWVNVAYEIFNKTTGAIEAGPIFGNQIWHDLGGPCANDNDGDIIAQWDRAHHRWLLSQNVFEGPPYYACVAVSTSPDATGTYYEYQFPLGNNFPDYPKWGIWPNGYYETNNAFGAQNGAYVCALNSAKLLVGDRSAEQICFQLSDNDISLLPGDLDSSVPPPANQDEFFIGSYDVDNTNNHLYLYSMHPVYSNPTQSTFTGNNLANPITVPTYTPFCPLGESCVTQEGTTTKVDALGDRLMYRFAYWDDGPLANINPNVQRLPYQHWYVNHVVTASGGQPGVRWYEFRAALHTATLSNVSLYQSGTFAPDSNSRWMASLAQDKMGNVAMGYSIASSTMYDSINATGRAPTDPLGQMQAEVPLIAGTGSQSATDRWGDYSSMSIDGSDGCTFWYAQEYYTVPASGDWNTRLTALKFNNCH